jgi:DNA polymerase-3 subunit alpha
MIGGMIASIKHSHTKNPKPGAPSRYAMFDLEDTEGIMRCICWPEQFSQYGESIQPETICVLRGAIDKRPGSEEANLIVNEVIPIGELESRYTRGIRVRVLEESRGVKKLEMLYEILRGYPGDCPFELMISLADGRKIACRCDTFRIANNAEMRSRVEELLGAENFRLITARPSASANNGRSRS